MTTARSHCVQFSTELFDYTSDLPSEYNAGNRFYGRDVATHLSEGLSAHGINADYLDEDWGWLVVPVDKTVEPFEIAIYNLSEHSEGGRPGTNEWGLWIRAYERKKALGFFPTKREVEPPASLLEAIGKVFAKAGIELEPWSDGPNADA